MFPKVDWPAPTSTEDPFLARTDTPLLAFLWNPTFNMSTLTFFIAFPPIPATKLPASRASSFCPLAAYTATAFAASWVPPNAPCNPILPLNNPPLPVAAVCPWSPDWRLTIIVLFPCIWTSARYNTESSLVTDPKPLYTMLLLPAVKIRPPVWVFHCFNLSWLFVIAPAPDCPSPIAIFNESTAERTLNTWLLSPLNLTSIPPVISTVFVIPSASVASPSWILNATLFEAPVNPPPSMIPFLVSKLAIELLSSNLTLEVPVLPGDITYAPPDPL